MNSRDSSFPSKQVLRSRIKDLLKNMTADEKMKGSLSLTSRLIDLLQTPRFLSMRFLGGYAPMGTEPNWLSLSEKITHLKTAFPGISPEGMVFKAASFDELIQRADFGVTLKLPSDEAQVVTPDILFVPGLGFTARGQRLGRGGGYYDRYLKEFKGIKIGLCFENQIQQMIPVEEHDQNVDWVVTDENFYGS